MSYAIVQHSGVLSGHLEFEHAVEATPVTKAEEKAVERVGGIIVQDYVSAEDLCMRINYPAECEGLVPRAAGTFSNKSVGGLRIYIPVREVVG